MTAAPGPTGQLARATLCTTVGATPVFLVGALAVLVRAELSFSETQLGAAVSVFFAVSAVGSVPGGWVSERLGAARAMVMVSLGSAAALLGMAALTYSYAHLLGWIALAVAANAICQPATNLAIAREFPRTRQGFAFGVKQAAVPMSTMLSGIAVPTIGLTIGWRWAFAGAALGAVALGAGSLRAESHRPVHRARNGVVQSRRTGLVVIAIAAGCAAAAGTSLGAFYVESTVARGVSASLAGVWFAIGSAACILGRVGWGWVADRRGGGHFQFAALLLVVGAAGFATVGSITSPVPLAIGTIVAFAAGWGWSGVLSFAVVRKNQAAPAAATGITQTGAYAGGMIGPVSFGALLEHVSHVAAWSAAAGMLVAAGALILVGRILLKGDRGRRGANLSPNGT